MDYWLVRRFKKIGRTSRNWLKNGIERWCSRRLGFGPAEVFAAGDHLNDLPMPSRDFAHWLASPHNAIPPVKAAVRAQQGRVSSLCEGHGVAEALMFFLAGTELKL